MPRSVLDEPRFRNETAAYRYVESVVWPNGRVCPHCGVIDQSGPLKGKRTRLGTYKCYACRKPFTVKVGTIFEKSHVPLHIWLQAMHLLCSSKKGFSANQFCRVLGVDFKTGWFIGHRIREAMRDDVLPPLGGAGKIVEVDETYYGKREGTERGDNWHFSAEAGWASPARRSPEYQDPGHYPRRAWRSRPVDPGRRHYRSHSPHSGHGERQERKPLDD